MIHTVVRKLCAMAIAGAAVLGSVGSANAATYGLTLDPAFGAPFSNLGWQASGQIELDGNCAAMGNGTFAATCTGLSFSAMSVSFYNVAAPSTILETFDVLTGPVSIQSFTVTGGLLTGIEAGFFANFTPTGASSSIAGNGAYSFALYVSAGPVVGGSQVSNGDLIYFTSPSTGPSCIFSRNSSASCGVSQNVAVGAITPVPEPKTYALMLAGLAAVGFMARRRRQA